MTPSTLAFRCPGCGGVNRLPAERLADGPTCGRCQTRLDTSGQPIDLDDTGLERLVKSSPVPVLVDLWAPWCGPCRMVGPIVDQLARTYAGRLIAVKINTDEHPRTLASLGARGIPTFALYRGGALFAQRSGALPKPQLDAWIQSAL
ncbi:MAG: thioredoxin domain-containing protein [Planctomycetota bacterium]